MTGAMVAEFERLVDALLVPTTAATASAALLDLEARPDAVAIAQLVIPATASPAARFHACRLLRVAALSRWPALPASSRYGNAGCTTEVGVGGGVRGNPPPPPPPPPPPSLRGWLLSYIAARGGGLSPLELRATLHTAAALARRAYLEEPSASRAGWVRAVASLPAPLAAPALAAIAEEMAGSGAAVATATAGVERQAWRRARGVFLRSGDSAATVTAAAALVHGGTPAAAGGGGAADGDPSGTGFPPPPAVAALLTTLSARFPAATGDLRPPAAPWRAVLADVAGLLGVLFRGAAAADVVASRGGPAADIASGVATDLRSAVAVVAGIRRSAYPSAAAAEAALAAALKGAASWGDAPASAVGLRVAYAELWERAVAAHGLARVAASGCLPHFGTSVVTQLRLPPPVPPPGGAGLDEEEELADAAIRDTLMEAASLLVADAAATDSATAAEFRPLVLDILAAFVDGALTRAAAAAGGGVVGDGSEGEEEEEDGYDESVEEARFETAASLFRFAAAVGAADAVASLASLLSTKCHQLFVSPPTDNAGLAATQESVTVLLGLAAAVLADAGRGETPSVPPAFLPPVHGGGVAANGDGGAPAGGGTPAPDAAAALFRAIISAARQEAALVAARGPHAAEASPRVAAAALGAVSRLARTYLLGGAGDAIGGPAAVRDAQAAAVGAAVAALTGRSFEPDVAAAAAGLLCVLAPAFGADAGGADATVAAAWQTLAAANVAAYASVPVEAAADVGNALAVVYGEAASRPAAAVIVAAAAAAASSASSDKDDDVLVAALALLRGVARHAGPASGGLRQAVLRLMAAAPAVATDGSGGGGATTSAVVTVSSAASRRGRPDVAAAVARLADDFAGAHLAHMSPAEAAVLYTAAVGLCGAASEAAAAARRAADADARAATVGALLSLLLRLLDKDAVDFAEDTGGGDGVPPPPCPADVVAYGLDALAAAATAAEATDPGLRLSTQLLVAEVLTRHPERVDLGDPPAPVPRGASPPLPTALRDRLLGTLADTLFADTPAAAVASHAGGGGGGGGASGGGGGGSGGGRIAGGGGGRPSPLPSAARRRSLEALSVLAVAATTATPPRPASAAALASAFAPPLVVALAAGAIGADEDGGDGSGGDGGGGGTLDAAADALLPLLLAHPSVAAAAATALTAAAAPLAAPAAARLTEAVALLGASASATAASAGAAGGGRRGGGGGGVARRAAAAAYRPIVRRFVVDARAVVLESPPPPQGS
ncbi:hypothetical protein MMPV_003771 [Pyropia vietnamensis]